MTVKKKFHFHTRRDELEVFWIPSDPDIPCELKVIPHGYAAMQRMVGGYVTNYPGGWFELPDFRCGCYPALMLDEDGLRKQLPPNERANLLLAKSAFRPVLGDALVVARGPITSDEWDLWGLPEAMNTWEGPGTAWPEC